MNSCLITKPKLLLQISKLCNESVSLGVIKGQLHIENGIKELLEIARNSPDPEGQIQLLNDVLDTFYNATNTKLGSYLSRMFPKERKTILFNPRHNEALADDKTVSSTFEETAKASRIIRSNNFLEIKFPGSSNAKLYFKRSILNDMVETFLVTRSGKSPKYILSQKEMNLSVQEYKQELLNRVFTYFEKDPMLKSLVKNLPRVMYDENGNYTGVIEAIKGVINFYLSPEIFSRSNKSLDTYYKEYRDGDKSISNAAKRFLDAYNAWVTLQNFDTIVKDTVGTIINISGTNFDSHQADLHKYEIRGRATNMWNNWTTSDDIADMSEVISDVTQALIDTSRMYQWGSSEPFQDRYISFHDFNYIIGKIKKFAFDSISDTIELHTLEGINTVSINTKRTLAEILSWNRVNGYYETNAAGESTSIPKAVTWKQLIARINENPQRYLHAIFDILCNTDLLSKYDFNDYEKNLIWSFNKEIFGMSPKDTRSLYRLHTLTPQDNVYQIITQVAASTFPEEYLQYFEKSNGSIGTRLLQDYALSNIRNTLFQDIQGTAVTLTQEQYSKYGITHTGRSNNSNYLQEVKIQIPINDKLTFTIITNANRVEVDDYSDEEYDLIWNNENFQNFIKDLLGINFEGNPDLKNAYWEIVKDSYGAVQDLSKLLGRIAFNSVFNTIYIPKFPNALTNELHLKRLVEYTYGKEKAKAYNNLIDQSIGYIPVLPLDSKDSDLGNLAMAIAINQNLLASAQSKTGEGTSLANYTLSRMRNFYQNQLEMQCKRARSAVRDLSFVINTNNLFEGILSRREIKTDATTQQSTKFSDRQSFQLSFINDFLAGYIPGGDSYIKNGRVSFLPTVNSDKPQIDGLLVNLNARTKISNGRGGFKTYLELSDSEIEQEMVSEFQPMYTRIVENITVELTRLCKLLPLSQDTITNINSETSIIGKNRVILNAINNLFKDDTTLGNKPKERIINGLHKVLTAYNSTHTRKPIMLAEHVHYVFDSEGLLTSNRTLEALWGRFNPNMSESDRAYLNSLYQNEEKYLEFLQRNGLTDIHHTNSFFRWQDHLTIKDLLEMKFKIFLRGSEDLVRSEQLEIKFLRGDAVFTDEQRKDPKYANIIALSSEMKNWVSDDGTMIIAKGVINGEVVEIKTIEQLEAASNLEMHPMLRKLNRLDYLCTQQYTISTVGSHYVHKGKGTVGSILTEESERWLASNKRNVAATSTVHLFQNKQLNGAPSTYNIAIIEDVYFDLYNIMGDLYLEGHAPLDGGMMVNAWIPDLENNSLAGEAAGLDKKQFGTFYSELYGAGGIIKTAGFAATNARMRRQKAWINLQRNMSNRRWVKEFPDENYEDVVEILDITKNYLGQTIDYREAIKGQEIYYKRVAHDNPKQMAAYRLHHIEYLGNNQYKIYEVEVNAYGVEIGDVHPRIENGSDIITIDNNWDLYTKIFGGYLSLEIGSDNRLNWSENSHRLMVYAINNVGYRKNTEYLPELSNEDRQIINTDVNGLDQDDIWLPLKYSDIHYTPNIGAIKSLQFNVNPDGEAVLNSEVTLNFMQARLAQLGIQLDKEHHADASEVSMPTQIIQALSNRSFTEHAQEVYTALATLTRQAIEPMLEGIQEIFAGKTPEKLMETISTLIVDNLISNRGEENSINAIMSALLEKADKGEQLSYSKDIQGKIPWSDPTISNKLFSIVSTVLTNTAVKMKFAGSLSVICPTDPIEKIYGDRLLSSFTKVYDNSGNTRTSLEETNMETYQQSVRDGKETDSDNVNMLIFDLFRDIDDELKANPNLTEEDVVRRKLSKIAELKTQHNYIIEFSDGSVEEITINTPEDYYRVKNLVLLGKRNTNVSNLPEPFDFGASFGTNLKLAEEEIDIYDTKEGIVAFYLSSPVLTQESVKKELGYGPTEIKKLFGLFKSKAKGGVSVERLAEQIYEMHSDKFEDDYEVRNLILNAISSAQTVKDFKSYGRIALERIALEQTEAEEEAADRYLLETYGMYGEDYARWYREQITPVAVTKIYENVKKGRALSAYNVRFTDSKTGHRFQIYDLDSVNLLFKLNNLFTDDKIKGYELFQNLDENRQRQIMNQIFKSTAFNSDVIYQLLSEKYKELPKFDSNFITNLKIIFPNQWVDVIHDLRLIAKPYIYNRMQRDLFKLSSNYKKKDRIVYANGIAVDPMDITTSAYELIMPKIYKTQFGLQEHDDLQEILRDEDFFVKRGLSRFQCKLSHSDYDYELKNFNGEHIYVLDSTKGIPEHIAKQIKQIFIDKRKGKIYRVDSNNNIIYEMSSEEDVVCSVGDVQIIVTANPLFYVQNLSYNTLKVSPERVTEESYKKLIDTLSVSKRINARNYLKAISNKDGVYFDLSTFKEFNIALDDLNYTKVKINSATTKEFKSIAQLCRLILQNGRELHTAFDESLNLIAGRIPAQSQQSFMAQRVIGFDSSDLNTAMVSTFQLFLQGSDLDIDAVTLLGYDFDKNGKFIGWSPYFLSDSKKTLQASKKIPLPTGKVSEVVVSEKATNNFFEVYNKYFGTLFKLIPLSNGGIKTVDDVPLLKMEIFTEEGLTLLADFLRDFKKYGINIKGTLINNLVKFTDDIESIKFKYNLTQKIELGGLGIRPKQLYAIAKQLIDFVNRHNTYINNTEEYLRDSMAKNYIVHYIYQTAVEPCNRTEAEQSLDVSTRIVKREAGRYASESGANTHAPGRVSSKVKMIGEGQAGKDGVGIGAVGIKANSTTQFYLSQILKYGSDWDKEKILFRIPHLIRGREYRGFANMYYDKEFDQETINKFEEVFNFINSLTSEDQITQNVAENIASMLSIAVDNAKDLALAKINSGPKLMGMYIYGMTLGIPIETLISIMKSPAGMILKELTEGSLFDGDIGSFRVLDVFDKLSGNFGKDLIKYSYVPKAESGKPIKIKSNTVRIDNKPLIIRNSQDALFEAMYPYYQEWFEENVSRLPRTYNNSIPTIAESFSTMVRQLIQLNSFEIIYEKTKPALNQRWKSLATQVSSSTSLNWITSIKQMVNYIKDMNTKIKIFNSGTFGRDLKALAEGAEEMRILGSILGINKGLKPTPSEAETFVDMFENLIYNRKKVMGQNPKESDRIDFHRFMLDENYQREVIDAYEKVKHSVNIPHLLTKVPHFFGYLQTQMLPTAFFTTASLKYRTMSKYRKTAKFDKQGKPVSLFTLFDVESKKDKEAVLRGLEHLIHHKIFTRWLYDRKLQFKVPPGFKYFVRKGELVSDPNNETIINLWTEEGLATFKKYMEEIYIPMLINDSELANTNEFVKNLIKISYNKTPVHSSVITYSLNGDLMARKGRQAELNAKMFADFSSLSTIKFDAGLGIPSLSDAFYIYAQYCYAGRKGQKSLMALFDNTTSRGSLASSFMEHVAMMDTQDSLNLSEEELIFWCAPKGNQRSKSRWIYGTKHNKFGISLMQRVEEPVALDEETKSLLDGIDDDYGEEGVVQRPERFAIYKYDASQYDRLTLNNFLVPITSNTAQETHEIPIKIFGEDVAIRLKMSSDRIESIQLSQALNDIIEQKINEGIITKFKSVKEFRLDLIEQLSSIHIPYKVSLLTTTKQEIDLKTLQYIIEQQINC